MLIVFGAINLAFLFPVSALPRGGDTAWSDCGLVEPGGNATNQAVAAARDGALVHLVGAVGQDALADTALAGLARAGVGLRDVIRVNAGTGRTAICLEPKGHTTVTADRGANRLARASQVGDARLKSANTLLLQMDTDPIENIALITRARQTTTRIILNLSPTRIIPADIMRNVDLLIGTSQDIAWAGEHLGTGNNPASIYGALGVATVRMMGAQGAEAMSDAGYIYMPAMPIEMRDATGAGDCFTGVLAAALSRGEKLAAAMRRAAVAAALSTTERGAYASMPKAWQIDAALRHAPQPTDRQPQLSD